MRISQVVGRLVIAAAAAVLVGSVARPMAAAAPDCGAATQALEHFRADLGLDRDVLARAQSLADAMAQPGNSASDAQLTTVAEDAADDLDEAAGQIDEAAQTIARQLEASNVAPQAQAWNRALSQFEAARNQFNTSARGNAAPGRLIRPLATLYSDAGIVAGALPPLLDLIGSGSLGAAAITELGNWIYSDTAVTNPRPNVLHQSTDPNLPVSPAVPVAVRAIGANARRVKAHSNILRGLGALQGRSPGEARRQFQAGRAELDGVDRGLQPLQSEVAQCAPPQPQARPAESQTPAPAAPASKPHGILSPKTAAIIAGAGLGGGLILSQIRPPVCCTPNTEDWSVVGSPAITCASGPGGCRGSITIDVPVVISAGYSWAKGYMGGNYLTGKATFNPASAPGPVAFDFTGSTWSGLVACSPITHIEVYNGNLDSALLHIFDGVSIPVSCQ